MTSSPAWRAWARAARTQFGLSQAEVGRRCVPPISAGRMSDLERGLKKPRDTEVAAITQVLATARRLSGEEEAHARRVSSCSSPSRPRKGPS